MYITIVELIFIIFFVLSGFIGIYNAWKCQKNMQKYKVKIHPEVLQESADDFPS